jgi:hypothetical protein
LLAPAHALAADELFWRHQARGLAVFVAPGGFFQAHKLSVEVAEAQHVGPRAHVKPLLPLLADDGRFYVLTAQVADTKLYLGTRHGLSEMDVDIPRTVAEVTAETDYENTRHAAPAARPRSAGPVGMPGTHNFGEDPEEQRKAQLVEHLRRLHNALERELAGDRTPIVVVAQPEMQGHLRALAKNIKFLEERVQKDPSAMKEQEIHEAAYEIVRPLFARDREHALDKFRALAGSNDARASSDLRAVVGGARFQRVDTLFLAEGVEVWGRHDAENDQVHVEPGATAENEDLLDYAAVHALANGAPSGCCRASRCRPTRRPAPPSASDKDEPSDAAGARDHLPQPRQLAGAGGRDPLADRQARPLYDRLVGVRVSLEALHNQHRTGNIHECHIVCRCPGRTWW